MVNNKGEKKMPRLVYLPMKIKRIELSDGTVMHQPLEEARQAIVMEGKK